MFNAMGNIAGIVNLFSIILSVISIVGYYKAISNRKWIKLGNISYHSMTIGIILMSLILLLLIVNHQYQYTYIFSNSSNELPFGYLLSTFYAGQEGSFLLWLLFLAIVGMFLINYSRKHNCEAQVMGTYAFIISFLLILIINKSPFERIWETYPDAIRMGAIPRNINAFILGANSWVQIPPDGNGLNPLLQNFWMQIHPPILFLGFALMAVPFAFAISALIQKDYYNWIKIVIPWILLASTVLGAGIILGGFWAYETLGWGGYWGWDPVENSSLIPWLVSVALVHTAYTQRRTNGLIKTNLFLAVFSFVLVIYSTFLTRSGVLQDSSVHSFTQPETIVYLLLLIFLLVFLIFGSGLILFRLRDILKIKTEYKIFSREVALSIGSVLLVLSAIIIFVGTSYPLLSKSNVDISFYNNWNLPLAILISFFNAVSLLLKWRENEIKEVIKKSIISFSLSIILTIVSILIGVHDFIIALLIWSSLLALFLNFEKFLKVIIGRPIKMGAFVSHIGVSLLFLGIVGSAKYSETKNIQLPLNKPVTVFDFKFTYIGQEEFDDGKKTYFNVLVERPDGDSFLLKPIMFFNQMSKGIMKIPDIKTTSLKDLYFSPQGLELQKEKEYSNVIEFEKGQKQSVAGYILTFLSYEMGEHSADQMKMGGGFSFIAKFLIGYGNGAVDTLNLKTLYSANRSIPQPQKTKDNLAEFSLVKISVVPKVSVKAHISYKNLNVPEDKITNELLIADISIKPLIILFWGGSIIMTIGFFISIIRRMKELKGIS